MALSLNNLKRKITPIINTGPNIPPDLQTTNLSKSISQCHKEPPSKLKLPLADKDYFSLIAAGSPEVEASLLNKTNSPASSRPEGPFTVLLVDNNHINISLLVAYIKKLGLDYITTQNGQQALNRFKESYFEIRIILIGKIQPIRLQICVSIY